MRIVSWNIAGGRLLKSLGNFDYGEEDLQYFADQLNKLSPDIVCLQENLLNEKRSVAQELAAMTSFPYIFEISAKHKATHIDPNYDLGMAILSKIPFEEQKEYQLPEFWFDLFWPNGKKAEGEMHHKFLQIVKINNFFLMNTQFHSPQTFNLSYLQGKGKELAEKMDNFMVERIKTPLVFCGDFNSDNPSEAFPKLFSKIDVQDCLANKVTIPQGKTLDHIFYTQEFVCKSSEVIKTKTDHFLCFAEVDYK